MPFSWGSPQEGLDGLLGVACEEQQQEAEDLVAVLEQPPQHPLPAAGRHAVCRDVQDKAALALHAAVGRARS